jgi:hypothetical protein
MLRPPEKKSILGYLLACAVILAVLTAAVALRGPLVAAVPQLNAVFAAIGLPVNVLGVEMRNVTAERVWAGGWERLRVTGVIVNVEGRPMAVPALQLTIGDGAGATLGQWEQTVADGELAAGTTLAFTTDFPEPPAGAVNIAVRFASGASQIVATR